MSKQYKLVSCTINGKQVEKMVDVPKGSILPVPTSNGQAMVSGMCTLPDGNTMLELDCELLLHD